MDISRENQFFVFVLPQGGRRIERFGYIHRIANGSHISSMGRKQKQKQKQKQSILEDVIKVLRGRGLRTARRIFCFSSLRPVTGIKINYSRKQGDKKWKCDKYSKNYAI